MDVKNERTADSRREKHMHARISALALALVLAIAGWAQAQVTTTGTIQVVVQDAQGGRLPGVTVTARAADAVTTRTSVTNAEGVASLEALAPSSAYTVTTDLQGFQNQTINNVLVRSGQTATIDLTLAVAGLTEAITVSASAPVVDVTNATTGQDVTLELTERLPTGRTYQSYLQLVPGVMPDDPIQEGNPAARSGVNYKNILGETGISSDNVFYFDGINVTDPVTGTFGANLNTEIIQEQKVLTGGIPAEFVGAAGLISNVITKSGSNTFHGSANYFFQNANLVAENENGAAAEFADKDNAYTFGGPILRDRAWFFGSYRYKNREDDVVTLDTRAFMRKVDNTQHQGFAKGTWAPTNSDLVTFTYLSDPTDISGRRQQDITNARDRSRTQGGHRFGGTYNRLWNAVTLEAGLNKHNGEVSDFSVIRQAANEIVFQRSDVRTLEDEQLGGYGRDLVDQRDNWGARANLSYTFARHQVKGGFDWARHENFRDTLYLNNGAGILESLAARYAGVGITATDVATGTWNRLAFNVNNTSDFGGLINTINARADRARFYSAFDADGNGVITAAELGSRLVFNSTANNPDGAVNYDRTFQSSTGPQSTASRNLNLYVQDQFSVGDRWSFNVGLRAERYTHFATSGENIYDFPWEFAPRLSAVYDVLGDGRHKASAYWGRYFDPIRNDMTNFAGTLTGSVLEEQVYILGDWVTYRTRGGAQVQDALFAPTTQTPYTDDLQLGYAVDLGNNMSFESLYSNRRTRDVFEDYDLHLYADPTGYPGPVDHPDSLFLPLSYFGYDAVPASNFVVATLEGGKRDYHIVDLVFRKRFANRWQFLTSYTWQDAKGNTTSDGNADFQGDEIHLDPRAPNMYATQPGTVHNLFKGAGSYDFPFGLQLGAAFNWNSGIVSQRARFASNRNLPFRVPASQVFEYAGIVDQWVEPGAIGGVENPSYGTIDLRMQYNRNLFGRAVGEVFVDIFNVTDAQSVIRTQELVAGQGTSTFGDGVQWATPRRAFLGARIRF
jgi:hypothetical protein